MGFGPYRGGAGGGMGGMQQLMKQAQKMQQEMQEAQAELAELEVTGSASGMVEVKMTCDGKLTGISIKKEAVDPDDVEMLEDLLVAAFNDAQDQVEIEKNERMGKFGNLGGLGF